MDPSQDAANSDGETTTCAGGCDAVTTDFGPSDGGCPISTSDASKAEQCATSGADSGPSDERCRHRHGWRRIVWNFTPSWFSVNMGTGIVSILLHNLPYNGRWLQYISEIVFALNVFLFVLFLGLSLVRYTLYPRIWLTMIKHPGQSLFLGTFPMGLATIINMICFVCVPDWGGGWWRVAWALWWIDVAVASATCLYLPFVMYVKSSSQTSSTAADETDF